MAEHVLAPSAVGARFVLPSDPRGAVGFLHANLALRSRRVRWTRRALAAGFSTGLAPVLVRDRLVVWLDDGVEDHQLPQFLLSAHLERELGGAPLHVGIGVREPDSNHKPSLQLLSEDGAPVGYAKVGWNDSTRALVGNEARTLLELHDDPPTLVSLPRVLHAGSWAGRTLLVATALPDDLHEYLAPPPPADALISDIAGSARRRVELASSSYWTRVGEAVEVVRRDRAHPDLGTVLARYHAEVQAGWGRVEVELGRWHGDLVPWNVGLTDGRLHVWDWEHSGSDVPLGFDIAHWHFQLAFVRRGEPLTAGLAAAEAACGQGWPGLGLTVEQSRLVGVLYVLEAALRWYRLMRGGGGWDPRTYPALLAAVAERSPQRR